MIYESILSTHSILRTDYEYTQEKREEKKGKNQLSPQEKGEQLIIWVEEHGRVPKKSEEWGVYWHSIKQGQSKAIYDSILSINSILRSDYEKTQVIKEENMGKTKQSPQEKGYQLIAWVEEHGRAPKYTDEYGEYWHSIKQGCTNNIYISILSKHPLLKENYDNTQEKREENKKKTTLSPQERGELLIVWVEEHGRVPKRSEEHGTFWTRVKQGQTKTIYESILSTHPILRSDYEKTQIIKEENMEKTKQSPQYRCEQLIAWVEEHNRAPKRSEENGLYWYSIKQGHYNNVYTTILSTYSILKADYDNTKETQKENKKATKLSPQESGKLLIAWVEEHGRVPKKSEEYGMFWHNVKYGDYKMLYTLLLSTHPILRAEFERIQEKKAVKQSP